MPRDGSGNYSLPAGNPVVTGTAISSTVQNNTTSDIASALTQSLSRDGQTAMTGTLNMGNNAISNVSTITATTAAVTNLTSANLTASGSITANAFIPNGATVPVNGLYLPAANTIGLSSNTTLRYSINSTGNHVVAAPTAGIASTINGFAGSAVQALVATATGTVESFTDGTRTATIGTVAGGYEWRVTSNHSLALGTNNTVFLTIGAAGNITTVVPTSGVGLTVNGVSGQAIQSLVGASTVFSTSYAGDTVARGVAFCKFKGANTSRASTTTLTNDPDLTYVIPVAGTYAIRLYFAAGIAEAGGGLNYNLNYSGTIDAASKFLAMNATVTGASWSFSSTVNNPIVQLTTGTAMPFILEGVLTATTTGTVAMAWAQNSSNVGNTTIPKSTYMTVTQLS
jgi:hypothetical protein